MTANWRPDLYAGVAFNANPNQIGAAPVWSDLTSTLRGARQITYGRQYELDETQADAPEFVYQDVYEYLNPVNESSPYWPNVDSYRGTVFQAIWPNDGSTANFLNTAAPVPVPTNPAQSAVLTTGESLQQTFYDPTFESYDVAATVPWITAVDPDNVAPIISTTTPRTGTQDLAYSVVNGTTVQGIAWPVPCVPGREYTTSVYVRQSSASTQSLRVVDQNQVVDDFNRTTASGWGTATFVGGAWTRTGGTAADYLTAPGTTATPWYGTAYHSQSAVNTRMVTTAGSAIADSSQYVLVTIPVVATGGEIDARMVSRFADSSNYYFAELRFNTDTTVGIRIQRRVAGTNTSITSATLPFVYTAGDQVWLRFDTIGGVVRAKGWLGGTVEPGTWALDSTDPNITAAGTVGCGSILNASNTNTLPVALAFQQYSAIGSVSGSSTTTTGSYVRLSVTWTASQPVHLLQLATSGTAVAGDVLVDDLQHEQAAAASTFVDTGPVIYNVFSGYVERWPAQWHPDSQGFEGIAELTCVDGFAPLNTAGLLAAYPQAMVSSGPAHGWLLAEPDGSATYADVAQGSANAPLVPVVSKFGAGAFPAGDTPMNIPGYPAGTGVAFEGSAPTTSTQSATILGTTSVLIPPSAPSNGWGLTGAVWVNATPSTPADAFTPVRVFGHGVLALEIGITSAGFAAAIFANTVGATTFTSTAVATTPQVLDGEPHLLLGTLSQSQGGTDTTITIWVDGVQQATTTVTTASLGGTMASQCTSVQVGGFYSGISCARILNGAASVVSLWNRVLTSDEITLLYGGIDTYSAGAGWVGETSGQRIGRYLSGDVIGSKILGAYVQGAVSLDFGMSVMGVDDLTSGTDALTGSQAVATTENGMFWASPIALSFSGRDRRYLQTVSKYTFGEDEANGEFPYQTDVGFDWDPTLVFNPVTVTNADGIIAAAVNRGLLARYFAQSYSRDINVLDDNEAIDAANWLLAQHDRPRLRAANIVLDPASNPDLWPVVLGVQLNDRVTVKRRPKAANAGAGFTMSADYFVEKISHDEIDMRGVWTTTLQLSPVDVSQVWILDDTTYSVLGSTTILGY